MSDINSIMMVGRLTKDADRKEFASSVKFSFTMAVNKRVKEAGEWKNKANFFDIEAWNIDFLKDALTKGRQVAIVGELDSSEYMKDNRRVKRIFVRADNIQVFSTGDKKADTPKEDVQEELPAPEFDDSDLPPF